jgi:predicted transcriptional regulator
MGTMATLDNCELCGKIYARSIHPICPACYKMIEDQFDVCHAILKKNREMQIEELSEKSNVPLSRILKFIKEGRFIRTGFQHFILQCASCKGPTNEDTLCNHCKKLFLEKKETQKDKKTGLFHSMHHKKNRDD